MERSERNSSGVTIIGAEAPSAYHMAPRSCENNPNEFEGASEKRNQFLGSSPDPIDASMGSAGSGEALGKKKKRGRPRKYGANGTPLPMQISSSAPPVKKRGRGKLNGIDMKVHRRMGMGFPTSGAGVGGGIGSHFTPHIITVNTGEDVTMRVISFSQQGPRAICILAANGVISNVTLRQPDSSGGTLTYEGRFEILSLCGSFMETENEGTKGRSGGMSVSLAGPDGRVVGGGVAGLLIAATPIQVVVGSFVTSEQQDHPKPRKQKVDHTPTPVLSLPPPSVFSSSNLDRDGGEAGIGVQQEQQQQQQPPPISFDMSSWSNAEERRNSATDINISLPAH